MTLISDWGEKLDRDHPLQEYPRPQLQRDSYVSLNGAWEYQITERNGDTKENGWKSITVPFALGSLLSGTEEQLMPGKTVWYRRQFAYRPNAFRTWLNFEAVDMECIVFMNGMQAGSHKGGYCPFGFDVTEFVKYQNTIMLKIIDDNEQGMYAYGKQVTNHGGMWYTPSSGIWGSVWLEDIGPHGIHDLKITPDYDNACVYINAAGSFTQAVVTVSCQGHVIHSGITNDGHYTVPMPNFHAWTVDDPFLYDLFVSTDDDVVKSYFGMRQFAAAFDANGIMRFTLNHKPIFLSGLLDQGYSADGLMTYPSEEAMCFELQSMKDMGFNMLRKHVKVENRRWYSLCDHLGILVMQDMPSGGFTEYDAKTFGVLPSLGFTHRKDDGSDPKLIRSEASKLAYYEELDAMLDELYNVTSIFAWVPFNEGWGQFKSEQVTRRIKQYDRTRLVDSASGWFDQGGGDFKSIHDYFFPFRANTKDKNRILFLSEFGGYSYMEWGHTTCKKLYGYKKFKDKKKLDDAVNHLYEKMILENIRKGLSGCIYTQISDVEDECNGLFTYDRKILKVDPRRMKKMNERLYRRIVK